MPAALWAARNGQRVAISTHTINSAGAIAEEGHSAGEARCRRRFAGSADERDAGNYLCPRRLETCAAASRPISMNSRRWRRSWSGCKECDYGRPRRDNAARGRVVGLGTPKRPGRRLLDISLRQRDGWSLPILSRPPARGQSPSAHRQSRAAHRRCQNRESRSAQPITTSIVDEAHHLEEAITNGLRPPHQLASSR